MVFTPVSLRVIEGQGRPYLLVWNEGVLRSPATATRFERRPRVRPVRASQTLTQFVTKLQRDFPELTVDETRDDGCVRVEGQASVRVSLEAARELALDMRLSLLEPGRRTHVYLPRATTRICRTIIQALRNQECDLAELSCEDVELCLSRARDGAYVALARTEGALAANMITSLGYWPIQAGCYLGVVGWNLGRSIAVLLRQLNDLQRDGAPLEVTLHAPRLRSAR